MRSRASQSIVGAGAGDVSAPGVAGHGSGAGASGRSTITGTAACPVPRSSEKQDLEVPVSLWDEDGDEVARAVLTTRVGPKPG